MILRLILGDQLNINHSWFDEKNQDNYLYVLMEVRSETDYVKHHTKKITAFFAAMRNFGEQLSKKGLNVHYITINDPQNQQSFKGNILSLINRFSITAIHYQYPDEYRLYHEFKTFKVAFNIEIKAYESDHFYCTLNEIAILGKEKKYELLENFYLFLRKKNNVLMVQDKPLGGKWNFDSNNRNQWKNQVAIPEMLDFKNDVSAITNDLKTAKIQSFGEESAVSNLPINRTQALAQFTYFLTYLLPHFGTYQDAMHTQESMLFHSNLSFALNVKMLNPKEIVSLTESHFYENQDQITLAQVEGFIRQIIGWREYIRMMYWNKFQELKSGNYFEHKNTLPEVYWTGKSKMNCVATCAKNSLDTAYAHHIQRLMVLGNFALLMETHPSKVDDWYLGVYADAVEWVQLPNTRGMSQFAEGGIIATKPYISSSNYIDKMSNYCTQCQYDKTTKYEENSCPFNSLYWNFLEKNKAKLGQNQRMKMMYALLNKMDKTELGKIIIKAENLIQTRNF